MPYELIENATPLQLAYEGARIDVYSLGILHINLQDIFDKVAYRMLSEDGLLEPTWQRPRFLPRHIPTIHQRLVRADLKEFRLGSLFETVGFAIAPVLADANVIAVLQNLAANVIWATGLSGIRRHWRSDQNPPERPPFRENDPYGVGGNLRDIVRAFSETNAGEGSRLTMRCRRIPKSETLEITIEIAGH